MAVAIGSTTAGTYAAALHRQPGPFVVIVAAAFFAASLLRPTPS